MSQAVTTIDDLWSVPLLPLSVHNRPTDCRVASSSKTATDHQKSGTYAFSMTSIDGHGRVPVAYSQAQVEENPVQNPCIEYFGDEEEEDGAYDENGEDIEDGG